MEWARIVKLTNSNYEAWSFAMQALLRREQMWRYVEPGTAPNPVTDAWRVGDEQALATIQLTVDESQYGLIRGKTTAKATWTALKEHHQKASLGQKVTLLKQISNQNFELGDDMEAYLADIEKLYARLENSGFEMKECLKVALILRGLPESFNPLTTALEARDEEELTLDLIKVKLMDEAAKQMKRGTGNGEQALRISGRDQQRSVICYHCGKEGHRKRNCKLFLAECSSEKQKDEAKTVREGDVLQSFTFLVSDGSRDADTWVVDSGATSHMANDRSAFVRLDTSVCPVISTACGKKVRTGGVGDCRIECVGPRNRKVSITLTDVIFAPELEGNLISVARLATKGVKAQCSAQQCRLLYGGSVIATADCVGGLYVLNVAAEETDRENRDGESSVKRCDFANGVSWTSRFEPVVTRKTSVAAMIKGGDVCDKKIEDGDSFAVIPVTLGRRDDDVLFQEENGTAQEGHQQQNLSRALLYILGAIMIGYVVVSSFFRH